MEHRNKLEHLYSSLFSIMLDMIQKSEYIPLEFRKNVETMLKVVVVLINFFFRTNL